MSHRRKSPAASYASKVMRRANDVSQDSSFAPAPSAGKHDDPQYGTHHARDASRLLETLGWKPRLFSSAMKLNTQYMHSLWFDLSFTKPMTKQQAMDRLRANRRIAITEKRSSNQIFSFGRDHGYYGRILSQAVVAAPTITTNGDREVLGFCFTPQDGNSLASSIMEERPNPRSAPSFRSFPSREGVRTGAGDAG